jgi:cupin fold WbuC family metalloprotein
MTLFFPDQDIIEIGPKHLDAVKRAAAAAPLRRARYCLHRDHQDSVQEMVIAFCRDTYNRPHRHHGKSESFHVIEGRLAVVFFHDDGSVARQIQLGPPGSGCTFVYRLCGPAWHTVVPLAEVVVIHETTTGPFDPRLTEFAPWSPESTDFVGIRSLFDRLGYGAAAA